MSLIDFLKNLFNEKNKNRTYFAFVFSVLSIAFLVTAQVLSSTYGGAFLDRLKFFSFINLLWAILGVAMVLLYAWQDPNPLPDIEKEDVNTKLSYKDSKKDFLKYIDMYVIKEDKEYFSLQIKNKRMNIIISLITAILLLAYIPIIFFYPQIDTLLNSIPRTDLSAELIYHIIIKAVFDTIILGLLIIRKSEKIGQKKWERIAVLFPEYIKFLNSEIEVITTDLGTDENPGRGIVFKKESRLNPEHYRNTTMSVSDDLYIFIELARYLIYRNRNYNDGILYGLILSLSALFSFFLFDLEQPIFIAFFIAFLLILGAVIVYVENLKKYVKLAKGVLGFDISNRRIVSSSYDEGDYDDFDFD